MNKSVKNSTFTGLFFELFAIVAFVVCSMAAQLVFGTNYAHISSILLSMFETIKVSYQNILTLEFMSILTVLVGMSMLVLIIVWIVILAIRKNKTTLYLIICVFNFTVSYFAIVMFLFDRSVIYYNNQVELAKLNESLLVFLVKKIMNFNNNNPIYSFGMLGAFVLSMIGLVYSLFAFMFATFFRRKDKAQREKHLESKKKESEPEVKVVETKEEKPQPKQDDFDENDPVERVFKKIESNREELKPQEEVDAEDDIEQLADEVLDN